KIIAPDVFFVPVKTVAEAAKEAADADAIVGFCSADIIRAGNKLRWIQVGHAGVEKDLVPEVINSKVVFTNLQKMHGPNVADQAMALLLCLTRGIVVGLQSEEARAKWNQLKEEARPVELHGKTMLVVGLGGIGKQIARRAHAFGMRVMAVDANEKMDRPDYV